MAMVPNRSATLVRRVTGTALGVDVVVSLLIGLAISSVIGWVVFLVGLIITGLIYMNFRSVIRMRG